MHAWWIFGRCSWSWQHAISDSNWFSLLIQFPSINAWFLLEMWKFSFILFMYLKPSSSALLHIYCDLVRTTNLHWLPVSSSPAALEDTTSIRDLEMVCLIFLTTMQGFASMIPTICIFDLASLCLGSFFVFCLKSKKLMEIHVKENIICALLVLSLSMLKSQDQKTSLASIVTQMILLLALKLCGYWIVYCGKKQRCADWRDLTMQKVWVQNQILDSFK